LRQERINANQELRVSEHVHEGAVYEKYLTMQLASGELSQIAALPGLWDISHMARKRESVEPGIPILDLLVAAKPDDLSFNSWCNEAEVSTSYFTDLRKGVEPGLWKIERLARVIGLRLSELVEGVKPATNGQAVYTSVSNGERSAAPEPSAAVLTSTFAVLLESVGIDPYEDGRAQKLAARFPNALRSMQALRADQVEDGGSSREGPARGIDEDPASA
jgi:hypothetical protein